MKNHIIHGAYSGFLISIISFFISFIVGVFILDHRFPGIDYFGAIIYFPFISFVITIIFPYLMMNKERVKVEPRLNIVISSVLAGVIFCIAALLITNIYLSNINNFPALNPGQFELMVGYDVSHEAVIFNGLVLSVVSLTMSFLMRRKA
jgi:phosphoglycerol transferase MdoB-like AlkP superfamily enzyme